jgi:hypothetical protein
MNFDYYLFKQPYPKGRFHNSAGVAPPGNPVEDLVGIISFHPVIDSVKSLFDTVFM